MIKTRSVLVRLVTLHGAPCSTSLPLRASERACARARPASPYQELCRGEGLKQEMQPTPVNRLTLQCTSRHRAAAVQAARRAGLSVWWRSCTVRFGSYLPSAETFPLCSDGGEGRHKRLCLPSRSLPPSPEPSPLASFCNKDAQKRRRRSSCTRSHFASEACASVHGALVRMHGPQRRRAARLFCKTLCKRILRSSYMMGQGLAAESP